MSYPQSTKDQFLTLRADGLTYAQCAQQLNVSKHTLINWAKECKPQLEALLDQYQLRQQQRIILLAGLYHRVCRTIEKTDLLSKGVGSLFTILLKLNTALDKYDLDPASLPIETRKSKIENPSDPSLPLTARLAGRSDPATPESVQIPNPGEEKTEPPINSEQEAQNTDPQLLADTEVNASFSGPQKTEPKLNRL